MNTPSVSASAKEATPELLPNLILLGANKGGTSSLHKYLAQHPQIFMTRIKEPMFFRHWGQEARPHTPKDPPGVDYFFNTLESYQALFEPGRAAAVRGESSTTYLTCASCAARMRELIPDAKLVAVLREPVARAFSNWTMYRSWGIEKLSFEDAVREELSGVDTSRRPGNMRYLSLSRYAEGLRAYYDLFPKQQIRIFLYEELSRRPHSVLRQIYELVGVDTEFVADVSQKHNVSGIPRFQRAPPIEKALGYAERLAKKLEVSERTQQRLKRMRLYRPRLSADTHRELSQLLRSEVEELEVLLERDLSSWSCASS